MTYEQSNLERNLIGRRQALCSLAGITTAVAGMTIVGVGTARAAASQPAAELDTVSAQEVVDQADAATAHELALVEALIPVGLDLGKWSIEQVKPTTFGAIPVVMRSPAGDAFQVDVLRRDPAMQGVADTRQFSVFIANGGNGSTASNELHARGAKVLAYQIARTELSGAPLPKLMSFNERSRRHPFGNFDIMG